MSVWYVDPVNGNSNYAGSSFVLKTSGTDGVGNGTTTFTSATANFNSGRDAGQRINIAGTYYTIASVTNSTTIVLSATNTSGSGKSFWVGGALQIPSQLTSTVGIAAGDSVHVAKTSDPLRVQTSGGTNISATFTTESSTLTLDNAATANINTCESAWTADNSSTVSTSTTRKEGSLAATITTTTTAQLRAHAASVTVDLSGYTKISGWVRSSASLSASVLRIDLCSDANGTVPVHSFTIPFAISTNTWYIFAFDNGSALSSTVNSIALTTLSGISAGTITLDNIIAGNRLTHASVISKDSSATIDKTTDGWYGLRSINGTTVILEGGLHDGPSQNTPRGYHGTTATVALYARSIQSLTAISVAVSVPSVAGTSTNHITISGGYDTSSDTQTGETWWSLNGAIGIVFTMNQAYHDVTRIHFQGGTTGLAMSGTNSTFAGCVTATGSGNAASITGNDCLPTLFSVTGCGDAVTVTAFRILFGYCNIIGSLTNGITFSSITQVWLTDSFNVANCASIGFSASSTAISLNVPYGVTLTSTANGSSGIFGGCIILSGAGTITATNNGAPGINSTLRGDFNRITTSGNTTAGITVVAGAISALRLNSCDLGESTKIAFNGTTEGSYISVQKYQDTTGDARFISSLGTVQTDATTRHTVGGLSWKAQPNASATSTYPLKFPLQPIAVDNTATTFNVYCYRTSTSTLNAQLLYSAGDCIGANSDVTDTANGSVNTWEQLTISVTGTETNGAWTPYLCSWGDASNPVYFDDASAS